MADQTKIEWATHTFNPWIGCTRISPACQHCYAERDFDHRRHVAAWGPNGTRVLTSDDNWKKPIRWNRLASMRGTSLTYGEAVSVYGDELPECEPHEWDNRTTDENNNWMMRNGVDPFRRPRVFCASLADIFEEWDRVIHDHRGKVICEGTHGSDHWIYVDSENGLDTPIRIQDVRVRLFQLIDATPHLDWLLLTKRPENILKMWPDGRYRKNVWLGTSVENQEFADKRIPELLKCSPLSPVLFLSCEPLLGEIDLHQVRTAAGDRGVLFVGPEGGVEYACSPRNMISWVIIGGESGPCARPMNPDHAGSLIRQCSVAGVPVFFKQWGEFLPFRSKYPGLHFVAHPEDGSDMLIGATVDGKQYGEDHVQWDAFSEIAYVRVGKKAAGRCIGGIEHSQFPHSKGEIPW